jgi:hypothetical protein
VLWSLQGEDRVAGGAEGDGFCGRMLRGSFIEEWCGLGLVVLCEGKTQFEIRYKVGISKKMFLSDHSRALVLGCLHRRWESLANPCPLNVSSRIRILTFT